MWFRAALATVVMTLAVTPACAAKITVSQYGRIVATLPWAVALQTGMFKEAGLDIDGITAGAGGGGGGGWHVAARVPLSLDIAARGPARLRCAALARRRGGAAAPPLGPSRWRPPP